MKKMTIILLFLLTTTISFTQTSLCGKVTDADSGEDLIGANVLLEKNGVFVTGTATDFNGVYNVNIDPGTYDVKVTNIGYPELQITGVIVNPGQANKLDIQMPGGIVLDEVVVTEYKVPLIEQDNTTSGQTITSQQIRNLPTRNVSGLAATSAGLSQVDKGDNVTVRGSRGDATNYYIDGVRVSSSSTIVPSSEIDQLQVISGGVPAQYSAPPVSIVGGLPAKFGESSEFSLEPASVLQGKPTSIPHDPVVAEFTNEEYGKLIENDFISPGKEAWSTFSIDVDNASYSNMRRYIQSNRTPPKDAIRIEEMVNYFQYDYPQPEEGIPFSITTELGECPWNRKNKLLHIGLQGSQLNFQEAASNNLVFLIDVSGSMQAANKLALLKPAFKLLVEQLRAEDNIAIVTYAGNAGLVLPSTSGADKKSIFQAIDGLTAGGSTAGARGIELAYKIAQENYMDDGNNRVILATDGDFNVGVSSFDGLLSLIKEKRQSGIYITTLGFGYGNLKDNKLEMLADKGNGNYSYVDNLDEAKKVFVSELTGTLYTIAKDVKIQLEFDPKTVAAYRLIGYENRLLAKEDFDDDKKDAGELGAGHTVSAIYELEMLDSSADDLLNVKLRYKLPKEKQSRFTNQIVSRSRHSKEASSENFRFSAAVAGFGLILRDSKYKGETDCEMVLELAENAQGKDEYGYREEFIQLVTKYRNMTMISSK